VLEPGRLLVGNSGIVLTRVILGKQNGAKQFIVVDAAMNDLMRPALYDSYHEVFAVAPRPGGVAVVDVVGPVCESADILATERALPDLKRDDLLFIRSCGAYGMSMASQYNSRCRPAEVLVDGETSYLIRRRESLQNLWEAEPEQPVVS
jgi:diaminopimelate decarboxylase